MIKLCECGCGQPTKIITMTNNKDGRIKGEYSKFISGHNLKETSISENGRIKLSKKQIGKNNSFYGKKHTLKTKRKISEAEIGKNNSNWKGGKPHCKECGKLLSNYNAIHCQKCYDRKGEKSGMWIDGRSFNPYPITFNKQLKDRIRVRDNFICQKCGVPELECNERLDIHHIDYNKKNCELDNLISLCRSCNVKVNKNREYWTDCFKNSLVTLLRKI